MRQKDYYRILGVSRNATLDEIKKAYRKIALQCHPDKSRGDKRAEERFKEATIAYQALIELGPQRIGDESLGYDRATSGDGDSKINDFFDSVFRSGPQTKRRTKARRTVKAEGRRGSNLRTDLTLPFTEAMLGTERSIRVHRNEECESCDGTGAQMGSPESTCPSCMGNGELLDQLLRDSRKESKLCERCQGTGVLIHQPCRGCRGTGAVRKERSLLVKMPPGIETGKSLRLPGQGECGSRGGPYGDLFVDVVVKSHPILQRDGYDLRCQVPVGFATASLGGEVHIPTLTDPIVLNLPRGTQPNQTFRLTGQGIKKSENENGDLIVTVVIEIPKALTRKQERLLKRYLELENGKFSEKS